jgi:hypothetical protein
MDWQNIMKMAVLPKTIYRFTIISIKISMSFSYMETQKPQMAKAVLSKKIHASIITKSGLLVHTTGP